MASKKKKGKATVKANPKPVRKGKTTELAGRNVKLLTGDKPLKAGEYDVLVGVLTGISSAQFGNILHFETVSGIVRIYSYTKLDEHIVANFDSLKGKELAIEYLGKIKTESGQPFHDFEIGICT